MKLQILTSLCMCIYITSWSNSGQRESQSCSCKLLRNNGKDKQIKIMELYSRIRKNENSTQ